MLDYSDALKELFFGNSISKKELEIYIPALDIVITESNLVSETMQLIENVSSDSDLKIGACEAAEFRITTVDFDTDLKGLEIEVYMMVGRPEDFDIVFPSDTTFPSSSLYPMENKLYRINIGKYKVDTFDRKSNRRFRDLVAYDHMQRFDQNIADWYNALEFPMTLRAFRAALMEYCGVTENADVDYLLNDDIVLTKNASITELSGRDLINIIEEINGVFGHIDRNGIFQHVYLCATDSLYPSAHLFPSSDIYPNKYDKSINIDLTELEQSDYYSIEWEDFTVQSINQLIITGEDGSTIAEYGDGDNAYIIENNFLLWDLLQVDLIEVAYNLFGMIGGRSYVPIKSYRGKGLPWVEVGDSLEITTNEGVIRTYVLTRTLSGMQAMKDQYQASGSEKREFDNSIDRTLKTFVNKANATFKVMDAEIDLRVTYGDVVNAINISQEGITIQAEKISLEGIVTANQNFKILEDGSMEAVNGRFSGDIEASDIRGTNIYGSYINGTTIVGGDEIAFEAIPGQVSIGDFYVSDEYGRHIFQSYDECTGMSTGDVQEGELFLWAGDGYGSGTSGIIFLVNQLGQVRIEGDLYLNDVPIEQVIKDLIDEYGGGSGDNGGGGGGDPCSCDEIDSDDCPSNTTEGPGCCTEHCPKDCPTDSTEGPGCGIS